MLILLPVASRWHCCYTFSHGYVESTVWQDVVTAIEMVLAGNYVSALLIKQCVHETKVPRWEMTAVISVSGNLFTLLDASRIFSHETSSIGLIRMCTVNVFLFNFI